MSFKKWEEEKKGPNFMISHMYKDRHPLLVEKVVRAADLGSTNNWKKALGIILDIAFYHLSFLMTGN